MEVQKRIYFSVIFLLSFVIYLITLAPGLTFTDAGELAGACSTLGIAHPTGYPLFTILGYLWTMLPIFSTEIFALNVLAALFTALSASFLFMTILNLIEFINIKFTDRNKKSIKNKANKNKSQKEVKVDSGISNSSILIISIVTSLTYAFASTIWSQATAIEVYSLHLLLINIVLYFFFKGWIDGSNKAYILASLFLGLSFANHMTTVLLLPLILFLYFYSHKDGFDFSGNKLKYLLILLIPFLIGLSIYLYLPIRSAAFPEFNWGWVSRGFDKFWYHFSGKQYQVWMFSGADVMKENFARFFEILPYQLGWLGFIPVIYGLIRSFKASKALSIGLIILILSCVFYAINYSIHDIDSYFVAAFIGFLLFAAIGFYFLLRLNDKLLYTFFIIPIVAIAINFSDNDRSDDVIVPEYTNLVFQKIEPNAIILSSQWDYWVSAAWYLQRVEGFREDVVIIDKELLRRTWYLEQLKRWYPERIKPCIPAIDDFLIDLELFESGEDYSPESIQKKFINLLDCFANSNYGTYPVYMTLDVIETEKDVAKDYQKIATGFAFKLTKSAMPEKINVDDIDIRKLKESIDKNKGHLVDGIKAVAAVSFVNMGRYALMTEDKETARKAFEKGFQISPENRFVQNALRQFNNFRFE